MYQAFHVCKFAKIADMTPVSAAFRVKYEAFCNERKLQFAYFFSSSTSEMCDGLMKRFKISVQCLI